MAKFGPRPRNWSEVDNSKYDGKKHGIYWYTQGCRCEICRGAKKHHMSKAKTRPSAPAAPPAPKVNRALRLSCDEPVKGPLPLGKQMPLDVSWGECGF